MRYLAFSGLFKPETSEIHVRPDYLFRPNRLRTSVEEPGVGEISGIYIEPDPENQLTDVWDAWEFSNKLEEQLREEFLTAHGLLQATSEEIDDYLDEHELSIPSVGRILLPTVNVGCLIRITGSFNKDTAVVLGGHTP